MTPSPPHARSKIATARAAAVACGWLALFTLATPGLDLQSGRESYTRAEIWEIEEQHGKLGGTLAMAALEFNQRVREPVLPLLQAFMRPIRGGQAWALFTRGREKLRWFEVEIDGKLVHRSASRTLTWRESSFRNRHVRPIVAMFVTREHDENPYAWGLVRWVAEMVQEDFPEARSVRLRGVESSFPKGELREIRKAGASAPDWEPRQ